MSPFDNYRPLKHYGRIWPIKVYESLNPLANFPIIQWSRNWGGGGHWHPPIIRLDTMYVFFQFSLCIRLSSQKSDLSYYKIRSPQKNNCGHKFSNQSHTHNLYWWPPQHAIASYSTVIIATLEFGQGL